MTQNLRDAAKAVLRGKVIAIPSYLKKKEKSQINTLLNNQEIIEENKEEIKKYLERNDNEHTMTQNLWDAAKAVLRGKFIAIQSYLKKNDIQIMNNTPAIQSVYHKQLKIWQIIFFEGGKINIKIIFLKVSQ